MSSPVGPSWRLVNVTHAHANEHGAHDFAHVMLVVHQQYLRGREASGDIVLHRLPHGIHVTPVNQKTSN